MSSSDPRPPVATNFFESSEELREISSALRQSRDLSDLDRGEAEVYNTTPYPPPVPQKSPAPRSELRQNLFMIFITLTQLVQMIPLGVGINSGLAIGKALEASRLDSVWIVASYPLTQGAFVLIGRYSYVSFVCHNCKSKS